MAQRLYKMSWVRAPASNNKRTYVRAYIGTVNQKTESDGRSPIQALSEVILNSLLCHLMVQLWLNSNKQSLVQSVGTNKYFLYYLMMESLISSFLCLLMTQWLLKLKYRSHREKKSTIFSCTKLTTA